MFDKNCHLVKGVESINSIPAIFYCIMHIYDTITHQFFFSITNHLSFPAILDGFLVFNTGLHERV